MITVKQRVVDPLFQTSSVVRLFDVKKCCVVCFLHPNVLLSSTDLLSCFTFRSWVFFSFSVHANFPSSHPSFILEYSSSHSLFLPLSSSSSALCGLAGPRPYGLEEDVRQYEQDLAKRLYQARVRAAQGAAAPPQPHSSSSASASATSQLRSAPWPQPGQTHGIMGWAGVLWCLGYFARSQIQKAPSRATLTVLSLPSWFLFGCTSLDIFFSSCFWLQPLSSVLSFPCSTLLYLCLAVLVYSVVSFILTLRPQ